MENGLPQNTVQALIQTRDGFVWLGTEVGLVRFDGNSFALFDHTTNPALPGNDVRCLFESRDGSMWIGTSEGLARWKDGAVTTFTTANGLPGNVIRALAEDNSGALWVYTDAGLARKEGEHFKAAGDWRPGATIPTTTADGQSSHWVDSASPSMEAWRQVASQGGLSRDGAEFLATLHGQGTAVANKSVLIVAHPNKGIQRLAAGREISAVAFKRFLRTVRASSGSAPTADCRAWWMARYNDFPSPIPWRRHRF